MTHPANSWMKNVERWFATHPERDFMVDRVPITALPDVSRAGWIGAVASQVSAPDSAVRVAVEVGQSAIDCIVRRPDLAESRPLPGVLLLDFGEGAAPFDPPFADPARAQEQMAECFWVLAQEALAANISLLDLLQQLIRQRA